MNDIKIIDRAIERIGNNKSIASCSALFMACIDIWENGSEDTQIQSKYRNFIQSRFVIDASAHSIRCCPTMRDKTDEEIKQIRINLLREFKQEIMK